MIQHVLKVLTLGFFFSTITGFVMYRMGYFEAESNAHSLQTSHNGGELLNANIEQDTNRTPQINQSIETPILPSSKSVVPVFDLEKYEEKKRQEILPSSKSGLHPIQFTLEVEDVKEQYTQPVKSALKVDLKKFEEQQAEQFRLSSSKSVIITDFQPYLKKLFSVNGPEGIKIQPQLIPTDSSKIEKDTLQIDLPTKAKRVTNQIDFDEPKIKVDKPRGVAWGMIGLGVLGILFVGIGSIVYFKRKST